MNQCVCGNSGWAFHIEPQPSMLREWNIKVIARCTICHRDNPLFISAKPSGDGEWGVMLTDDREEWPLVEANGDTHHG